MDFAFVCFDFRACKARPCLILPLLSKKALRDDEKEADAPLPDAKAKKAKKRNKEDEEQVPDVKVTKAKKTKK